MNINMNELSFTLFIFQIANTALLILATFSIWYIGKDKELPIFKEFVLPKRYKYKQKILFSFILYLFLWLILLLIMNIDAIHIFNLEFWFYKIIIIGFLLYILTSLLLLIHLSINFALSSGYIGRPASEPKRKEYFYYYITRLYIIKDLKEDEKIYFKTIHDKETIENKISSLLIEFDKSDDNDHSKISIGEKEIYEGLELLFPDKLIKLNKESFEVRNNPFYELDLYYIREKNNKE